MRHRLLSPRERCHPNFRSRVQYIVPKQYLLRQIEAPNLKTTGAYNVEYGTTFPLRVSSPIFEITQDGTIRYSLRDKKWLQYMMFGLQFVSEIGRPESRN